MAGWVRSTTFGPVESPTPGRRRERIAQFCLCRFRIAARRRTRGNSRDQARPSAVLRKGNPAVLQSGIRMLPARRLREVQLHGRSYFHSIRHIEIDGIAAPDTLKGGLYRGGIVHLQSVAT